MRRSLPGGVVLEALAGGGRWLFSRRIHFCACLCLVYFASSRSRWSSVGRCFAAVLLWQMLCRLVVGLSSLFGRMLCRRCWSVRWMLCHLVCVADLRTFGGIVSFSRSSCWLALGCRVGGVLPGLTSAAGCLLWSLAVCLCFLSFFYF